MRLNAISLAIGLATAVGITGCGGDGGSSLGSSTVPYSVTAIDGYLQNARVWLDLNRNYLLDADEPSALSGTGGVANLDISGIDNPEQYPVIVQAIAGQTVDEDEPGVTVSDDYMMSAPPGEQDVTPLTTLVHVLVEQNTADDADEATIEAAKQAAIQQVADQLGLPEDEILGDFIESGTDAAAYAAENIVDANILPQTPEELEQVSDESNVEESNQFLNITVAVNNEIKKKVEEIIEDDDLSFEDAEPAVDPNSDLTIDTDGDGVPDSLDWDHDNELEWLDSDGDGTGDNADLNDDTVDGEDDIYPDEIDAFPTDRSRAGDHDGDDVDSIDDVFPQDGSEWVDTDEDEVGDNADLFPNDPSEWADSDDDGYGDNEDLFDDDDSEWYDNDGDSIGDNADPDDDNDGVRDEFDDFPLDDEAGNTDNAKVASYLSQQSTAYIFDGDIEDGYIDIETLAVVNGVAMISSVAEVNQFGEFVFDDDDDDLVLSNTGWVQLDGQYTLDFSDPDNIEAYATNFDFVSYSLDADVTDLSASNVSQYILDEEVWDEVLGDQSVFSDGAVEISASLIPDYDIYFLYPDYKPWIHRGDGGQSDGQTATTLEELVVDTSIGQQASTGELVGIHIAGDGNTGGAVELVEGLVANYYTMNYNTPDAGTGDTYATLVGTGTWSESPVVGTELIEFTVPQNVITTWGEMWDEDSSTIVLSVYDGYVRRGSVEKEGIMLEDDDLVIVNQEAKDEILDVVDLPLGECYSNNVDSGATTEDFELAIAACGGLEGSITSEMVSGNTFERYEDHTGDTRQYTFAESGVVYVGRNGSYQFSANWTIESSVYLRVNYDGGEIWHWALLKTDGNQWSVKHLDQSGGDTFIWSEVYESSDNAVCGFPEIEEGATQQDFDDAVADYEACAGIQLSLTDNDIVGLTITRTRSNGEIRSYEFSDLVDAYTGQYYRNGSFHYNFDWRIDNGEILSLLDGNEVTDQLAILKDAGGVVQVAHFAPFDQEMWSSSYEDVSNYPIGECHDQNTEWGGTPSTTASFDDFLDAVDSCKDTTGVEAYFSDEYFDRSDRAVKFTTSDESYTILNDGSGSYTDLEGQEPETFPLTWVIDTDNDLLVLTITAGDIIAIDYLSIVDTDGTQLSLKVLSKSNEDGWPGIAADDEGDLWSGVYTSSYESVEP